MSAAAPRPSLREFLEATTIRTGERLELTALAEMSGYTGRDAQAAGWPDLFRASAAVPVVVDSSGGLQQDRPRLPGLRAFGQGLLYMAPVLALWSLFPALVTAAEVRFLALVVVVSWGGTMASNHVVGTWLWGDVAVAWRIAVAVAAVATTAVALLSMVLLGQGTISAQVAGVAVLQVVYFFSAGPLMLRKERLAIALACILGATAGLAVLIGDEAGPLRSGGPDVERFLQGIAAACLIAPSLLLVRQAARSRRAAPGRPVVVVRRDTVAFAAYGTCFGCLVLWGPVVMPGSTLTMLLFVVVAGIAFAEMAVALVSERAERLLALPYDPRSFPRRARWIVLSGSIAYAVPIGVGLALALDLAPTPGGPLLQALAVAAVCAVGTVQMLALIGMSLHGIRPVALGIAACTVLLLAVTWLLHGPVPWLLGYVGVLGVLCVWLLVSVMRLCAHPINFL